MLDEAFVAHVQCATSHWAKLLQAMGGNLKPGKCYWYLLSYKWIKGRASIKSLHDIRQHKMRIPQPGQTDVNIKLQSPLEASQVLGIWSCPSGDGRTHLQHMLAKGWKWGACISASHLSPWEVWRSFHTQVYPSVSYGIVPPMASCRTVDDAFSSWYYTILPSLGVNRNITTEWRTLPVSYQGLGLPKMSIEKLAASLHYLQKHWGYPSTYGRALRCAFELSQVEIGFEGNFLLRDYAVFGQLATHTWFKVLWEYLDFYGVQLHLESITVPKVSQNERVFMEEIVKLLPTAQWGAVNRVHKFSKVYFMSQILHGDGKTVQSHKVHRHEQPQSTMRFPIEQPTAQDFWLWKSALQLLTSPRLHWSLPSGALLQVPYEKAYWLTNEPRDFLVKVDVNGQKTYYAPMNMVHSMQNRTIYHLIPWRAAHPQCTQVATVITLSETTVKVHSQAKLVEDKEPPPTGLAQAFQSMGSSNVWK